jgi:hypothetical protein
MTPAEEFIATLRHVMGAPLDAAGYILQDHPMQQARGLFRFVKGEWAVEFQTLYHPQSSLSRFRVSLTREGEERSLSDIIWTEYGARVLPAEDHWWLYKAPRDLAPHLVEAGKLLFGYGIPWLEGWEESE